MKLCLDQHYVSCLAFRFLLIAYYECHFKQFFIQWRRRKNETNDDKTKGMVSTQLQVMKSSSFSAIQILVVSAFWWEKKNKKQKKKKKKKKKKKTKKKTMVHLFFNHLAASGLLHSIFTWLERGRLMVFVKLSPLRIKHSSLAKSGNNLTIKC